MFKSLSSNCSQEWKVAKEATHLGDQMSRHPFDLLMELDSSQIRLDCAALHLARDEYPGLNISRYLRLLDELAEAVAAQRAGAAANLRYLAMRAVLLDEYAFDGNRDDYYDPENSYLNRVLDTRRGIPISLAMVWIEVGRRLKWPVHGVPLPGHFLVRIDDAERFVLVDPFHEARSLDLSDCRQLLRGVSGGSVSLSARHLKPADTRMVLRRMLENLRRIFMAQNDLPRLAGVLRRLVAVEPREVRYLQDLATVHYRLGDVRSACAHLQLLLEREPDGQDSSLARTNLRQLRAALLALN